MCLLHFNVGCIQFVSGCLKCLYIPFNHEHLQGYVYKLLKKKSQKNLQSRYVLCFFVLTNNYIDYVIATFV